MFIVKMVSEEVNHEAHIFCGQYRYVTTWTTAIQN